MDGEMPKKCKLRYLGDPILAAKAKPIERIDDDVRSLAREMLRIMYESNGIGLAGNQVGVPLRIVTLHIEAPKDEDSEAPSSPGELELLPKMPITLINPEIVSHSDDAVLFNEGCLSVPKIYADVARPSRIVLKSKLLDNSEILLECAGLLARCVQHELDHLDGIVFVQKVPQPEYAEIEKAVNKLIRKNGPKNFRVRRLV